MNLGDFLCVRTRGRGNCFNEGMGSRMRTAIIGGGIAGLSAAYELEKARQAGAEVEYTLFEARERLGGCLASEIVDGAVLERGPDSFLSEKPAAAELCRELGLGAELLPSNDAERKTYILVRNRLVALPDGPDVSGADQAGSHGADAAFQSADENADGDGAAASAAAERARRVRGRAGGAALWAPRPWTRLADPLLSGIFGGDAAQLSARMVLPRLVEMESEYGSLTSGMLAAHRKMRARARAGKNGVGYGDGTAAGSGRPAARAIFTALRGGMQQLVDALEARIDPARVRCLTPVIAAGDGAGGLEGEGRRHGGVL